MKSAKWTIWLLIFALCMTMSAPVSQAAQAAGIRIILNGKVIESEISPFILPKVNVTMVPLRIISEELGAIVNWNAVKQIATIQGKGNVNKTITMTSGSTIATVNGESIKLDAAAQVKAGRTMVPLRFVSEQLGLIVNWNQKEQLITLLSNLIDNEPEDITQPTPPDTGTGNGAVTELRGAWVSTVYNLDWPSTASYKNTAKQKDEFISLLNDLQGMGLNSVFVQIRPSSDAFYPSKFAPWSKYLTGSQGIAPDYDPLAFMIEEAHKRNMEFHAWFNPFRASVDAKMDQLFDTHIVKQQAGWIVNAGDKLYINPGIPQARQYIIDTIMEVVNGYDIDGVHLDDYFYPSNVEFADDATFKLYNTGKILIKADWRRNNINEFVRQLGESIHAAKPQVSYGISPFGVWRNKSVDKTGSDTQAGMTAYDSTYADVRTWIKKGWIDYVTPQIYWSLSFTKARYDTLVDWWAEEVKGTGVKLYIGHSPYKLGTTEAGWQSAQEIINQLEYNKRNSEVKGDIYFSAKDLRKNPLGIKDALSTYYSK
ncbi:uncharacterized lipoprotein YddW (UPF0748 family) [Paenibacillus castaneae]|uniref:family 10 glycosylhydrolase n=1 Tax=Paenibacillus castaneae TaxID=474957 RepID=UPI000C9A911F|nr:family 10 glycosylhydrolase [Paenibacillus castaneae]NIK77751.1 uncharacterized lipoprotein YddW (UPF0748 family) [Paenibacillus castaneae]